MNALRIFVCLVAATGLMAACSSTPTATAGTVNKADVSADSTADTKTSDTTVTDTLPDTMTAPDATTGDTLAADTPTAKYGTCAAVGDCVALACNPTPTAGCEKACLGGGSQGALEKAIPMLTCIQDKCQNGKCKGNGDPKCVSDCIGQMCTPELVGCIDDGTTGTGVCGDAVSCFDKCNPASGYFSCMGKCYNAQSTAAKAALAIYASCAGKASGAGQDPTQVCISELMSCMTGGKTGAKDCYEIFACQEKCPPDNQTACMAGCLADTTAAGQKAFIDAMPCFGDQSKMSDPVCAAKFMACINPTGTKTCAQTLVCQGACPQPPPGQSGSPSCGFACMHDATPAAADAYLKISPCGIQDKTPEQAQACMDAMIGCANPSGTDNCGQILTCAQTCGQNSGQDCLFGCLAKGSVAGATAFGKLMTCKDGCDAQCKGSTDPQCSNACMGSKCMPLCVPTT